jgi:Kef-type K+ transport system membrane component KefB
MPHDSFTGVAIIAGVAFTVPLLLGLAPRLRLPSVVLEILAGIAIGPSGLGWVKVDPPIQVLSTVGLAFILLLAGLEVGFNRLRGAFLRVAVVNFLASFGLAVMLMFALKKVDLVESPFLAAIILSATSLGVIIPLLKDTGQSTSDLGQFVIAAASIADFGTIVLLSVFFSREAPRMGAKLVLLGTFAPPCPCGCLRHCPRRAVHATVGDPRAVAGHHGTDPRPRHIPAPGGVCCPGQGLGLEVIFGAFMAGAVLKLVDRDEAMMNSNARPKLQAVGFGVFIPIFFVTSGIQLNVQALFASASTVVLVPVFFAALLLIRGLPAWLYRPFIGSRRSVVAGMLQATSLPFIVVASQIGMELGMLSQATGAALIAAGLLSVLILPLGALTQLGRSARS